MQWFNTFGVGVYFVGTRRYHPLVFETWFLAHFPTKNWVVPMGHEPIIFIFCYRAVVPNGTFSTTITVFRTLVGCTGGYSCLSPSDYGDI